ncbi:MAG: hypothetical protein K2N80_15975 [Lachnospiraceae bacterium]|nr:hypothetical protein [Lachnospiraceae bacterium]
MKRNLFLLGIWMFTLLLWVGKIDARAGSISDFEKEIKEYGFRQSTEGMTVEEMESMGSCQQSDQRYRSILDIKHG